MNILPKKRWHVRTKENIARVRKDEAEAAEKERQEQSRIENADREARLSILKNKSRQKLQELGVPEEQTEPTSSEERNEHINLFANLDKALDATNKDHDKDVKEKKEEYEKKIGYLTYLGQDTNEALGKKNWYEVLPDTSRFSRSDNVKDTYEKLVLRDEDGKAKKRELDIKDGEVSWKSKQRLDPINAFRKYCHAPDKKPISSTIKNKDNSLNSAKTVEKVKHREKKHKKNEKLEKQIKLRKLRDARLKREAQEKQKTKLFLSALNGDKESIEKPKETASFKPKYNSQFNPELARQNYQ